MLELATLGDYLKQNPGIMKDRTLLQGILRDIFPQDRLAVNLLLMGFDEDIFSLAGTNPSEIGLTKLANTIVDDYGVTRENANYIIKTWLGVVFGETLPPCFGSGKKLQNARGKRQIQNTPANISKTAHNFLSPHHQINTGLSVADVREVFFRTKNKLMKKCKFDRSGDMETWDVVNMSSNKHYSRTLNQREKSLIVKRLGKGHYNENDFAYIRTSTDMALSWGVTYDGLIISARGEWRLPFIDIEHVSSERGLFTDTITIYMKDGSIHELDEHQMMSTPVNDNIEDLANFLNVVKDM